MIDKPKEVFRTNGIAWIGSTPPLSTHSKRTAPLGPFCFAATEDSGGSTARSARLVPATIGLPVSHYSLESRPAEAARRSLYEDAKRLTAEQRLAEFLSHCRLMAQLANSEVAGQHPPRNEVSPNAR